MEHSALSVALLDRGTPFLPFGTNRGGIISGRLYARQSQPQFSLEVIGRAILNPSITTRQLPAN